MTSQIDLSSYTKVTVSQDFNKWRLDQFLATRFPTFSRQWFQNQIKAGLWFINELSIIDPAYRLRTGDAAFYQIPSSSEPELQSNYKLLLLDDHFYAVFKPAGMPMHPSRVFKKNCLSEQLRERISLFGFENKIQLLGRLDRSTSGIVLGNRGYRGNISELKIFKKKYLIRVIGKIAQEFSAEGFIGPDPHSQIRKKQMYISSLNLIEPSKRELYKQCKTDFKSLKYSESENISLLEVSLSTGRMHQIRATLSSLGFPVVDDLMYGVDENLFLELVNSDDPSVKIKASLHCWQQAFMHPLWHSEVCIKNDIDWLSK